MENPIVLIVCGMPQNGKTQFVNHFLDSKKEDAKAIHVDYLFEPMHGLFPEENNIFQDFNIFNYVNHESFNEEVFLEHLKKALETIIDEKTKYYLIEGYVCEKIFSSIEKILNDLEFKFIYKITASKEMDQGYVIYLNDKLINSTNDFNYIPVFDYILESLNKI